MGILDSIREAVTMRSAMGRPVPFESPWASPNHLETFDAPTDFPRRSTREWAMRVPAVARARRLIVDNGPRCPLVARQAGNNAPAPRWMDRTDGPWSPFHRMAWTFDDLFFYGWSAWAVAREGEAMVAADRIPFEEWTIDADGRFLWRDQPVDSRSVVVIPGLPDGGILGHGDTAIGHAADLADAARKAARTPASNTLIKQLSGEPIPAERQNTIVANYVAARRKADHGVSFASANVDVVESGRRDPALLVDGRNVAAIDIARLTGIPATLLDANTGGSLTYQNTQARMTELVDFVLAPYMSAIAGRLGLDDVMPAGQSVEFDTSVLTGTAESGVSTQDDGNPARSVTPPTPLTSVRPTA